MDQPAQSNPITAKDGARPALRPPAPQPRTGTERLGIRPAHETLGQLNRELKLRLEERTRELATANLLLREEARERRQIEMALHESEGRFMAFMDNSPVMAFIKDEHGRYIYGNRRWKTFSCGKPDPNLRQNDFHPHPGENAVRMLDEDRKILATGKCSATVETHPAKDGRVNSWLMIKFPMLDPRGRAFIGGIAVDITERRQREQQILEISEREQQRIGQDLHDELCQHLAAIKFKCGLLKRRLETKSRADSRQAQAIEARLNLAIDRAHNLARGLHPVRLEADGLRPALRELTANLSRDYRRTCLFQAPRPVLIHDSAMAFHLFRIAQEAITNAIKHGKARKILVSLAANREEVILSIEDNGAGFPRKSPGKTGMGLHLMEYRSRMIGATLAIGPRITRGTLLTCTLPRTSPSAGK